MARTFKSFKVEFIEHEIESGHRRILRAAAGEQPVSVAADDEEGVVDADSKRDSICYSLGLAQARGLLDLAANPKLDPAPLIVT